MHVTFLLPRPRYPRFEKRVAALRSLGFETGVMVFDRSEHVSVRGEHQPRPLGVVKDADIIGRGFTYLRALPAIRKAMGETDVIYCFGVDLLALATLAGWTMRESPDLVVEVGDIPDIFCDDGVKSWLMRFVERRVLRGDVLVVVTSPTYVDSYYHGVQGLATLRTLVIENKIDACALPAPVARKPRDWDGKLRIGYFGLLRGNESWETLKRLASTGGERIQIKLRGVPLGDMQTRIREAEAFTNVEFGGSYRVPEDLAAIYGEIDLSWIVHYDRLPNWRWARSNRFYESCYFSIPMIGQKGKDDTRLVVENDLGVEIDVARPDEAVRRLLAVSREDVERWKRNLGSLSRDLYVLSDEHQRLANLLLRR